MKKHSFGRIIGISFAAIGCALISPFMLLSMSRVFLQSVVLALLVAWGGIVPGALFTLGVMAFAAILGTGYGTSGPMVVAVFTGMMLVPAWAAIIWGNSKVPYYKGLKASIGFQCLVTVMGIVALYLANGANVADTVTNMLRAFYDSQPAYVNEMTVSLLQQVGFNVTVDNISEFLDAIASAMQLALPVVLLTVSFSTPLCTYALSRGMNGRGDTEHVALCEWRVPQSMIWGVTFMFVACLILSRVGVSEADTAVSPIYSLGTLMFAVQGLAALDRSMVRNPNLSDTRRRVMLVLCILFCYDIMLPIAGILSALLGSQGIITKYIKKKNDKFKQGD